jgi:hypothetical protein
VLLAAARLLVAGVPLPVAPGVWPPVTGVLLAAARLLVAGCCVAAGRRMALGLFPWATVLLHTLTHTQARSQAKTHKYTEKTNKSKN